MVERGFDCWFVNARGNRFSLYHEDKDISYENFFDFTFDDYLIDLRSDYEYIMEKTNHSKLIFVANSIGGQIFAMSHSDKESKDFYKKHTEKTILTAPLLYAHLQKKEHGFNQTPESIDFYLKKSKEMGIHHCSMFVNFEDLSFLQLQWIMEARFPEWDLKGADIGKMNSEVDNMWSKVVMPDLKLMIFPFLSLFGCKTKILGGEGTSVKTNAQALR